MFPIGKQKVSIGQLISLYIEDIQVLLLACGLVVKSKSTGKVTVINLGFILLLEPRTPVSIAILRISRRGR